MLSYLGRTVFEQTQTVLYAVLLGAILCAVYDVFRIIRIAFGGKTVAVFIEDILFSIIALVLTFIFVVAFNNGELRFFVLIGELIGFIAYYFTVGKLTILFSKTLISTLKKTMRFILKPLVKIFRSILKKSSKKPRPNSKKHLKIDKPM